ncbi:MAG: hypothetical protein M1819_001519 [Sarea resinae]|nr:MAG: hypothetical protein M1819_001519 [Sarea resinae]
MRQSQAECTIHSVLDEEILENILYELVTVEFDKIVSRRIEIWQALKIVVRIIGENGGYGNARQRELELSRDNG